MILLLVSTAFAGKTVLIAKGADWSYLDDGVDPGATWIDAAFDDSAWLVGPAPLGYGLINLGTVVGYGPDALNKYVTTWFRSSFTIDDLSDFETYSLHLRRDDGAVVYLNGVEVYRNNLPTGTVTESTLALLSLFGLEQDRFLDVVVPSTALVVGENVVAIEVHQQSISSIDLVLDVEIDGWDGPTAVTRGPWIQATRSDGATIRWKSDGPSEGRVRYGAAPGALSSTVDDPTVSFDHELTVTGVTPGTDVAYSVGTPSGVTLAGNNADHLFRTAPLPGSAVPTRVWILGDSGTANISSEAVRDAYYASTPAPLDTDVWLMLGDNAYGSGTETEYQTAVFDFYPTMLRQVALWPSLGNHDGYSAYSDTQTGPYFDLFTLPKAGEAGGEPSGTEAYWSFDYGNIHFVDLDSYHSDRSVGAPMLLWLEADLAAAQGDWLIVFFHHPPYSKGSHNSDLESELVEMRENVLPILEAHGVDVVFSGHSHSYERSLLTDGHYDDSTTFDPLLHVKQDHDGDPTGADGAYTKWAPGIEPNQGAVYVVAGASGQVSGGLLDHPVHLVSVAELGSVVLDIDGLELEAEYLNSLGVVTDRFAIHKGVTTIVSISGDTLGTEAELLSFTGLAYQADGSQPPTYVWDWGDATPTTAGANASHSWIGEAAYTVTLTVTDVLGASASDTLVVNVDNGAPVIDSIGASPNAIEGTAVTLSAVATDPGLDPVTYSWLVDGLVYEGDVVSIVFDDDGVFPCELTVADDSGRVVVETIDVDVANAVPLLDSVIVSSGDEGSLAAITALASDPGTADWLTYDWDLGDGVSHPTQTLYHVFPQDGTFPVTVTITDDDGGETIEGVDIVIENVSPTLVDPRFSGDPQEGGVVTFSASATDPGVFDVPEVAWLFGDGTAVAAGTSVDHVFGDQGPYTVFAAAEDGDGGLTFAEIDLRLTNVPAHIEAVFAPSAVEEGRESVWEVWASDVGFDDVVTATWTFGDGGVVVGHSVVYAFTSEGSFPVQLEVFDDEGEGESVLLQIVSENAAPEFLTYPSDTTVDPRGRWEYVPQVRDVDPITFTLQGPPGAELDANGTVRWVAPAEAGSVGWFSLSADDGNGAATSQAWMLVVAAGSGAPDDRLARDEVRAPCGCASTGGGAGALLLSVSAWLGRRRRRSA